MDIFITTLLATLYTTLYFFGVALITLFIKYSIKLSGEWYRKSLHLFYMGSIICWLYLFPTWYSAVIVLTLFLIFALFGLTILEHYPFYPELLAERFKGEVKRSLT